MVEVGILGEADHVELLEGALVEMSPQGPLHAAVATALARRLDAAYGDRAHVRDAKPLAAGEYSLPEPDLAVVRGRATDYVTRHPTGDETLLVIELAWSSQDRDAAKAPIYASAGVPEYWLVDLTAATVTRHREPADGDYQLVTGHPAAGPLPLPGLAGHIELGDLVEPS